MLLFDFHKYRWLIEFGFWIVYFGTLAVVDAFSVITEHARYGQPLEPWEPFVWELSSVLLIGLLVIPVARLVRFAPFRKDAWSGQLAVHLLATVPFSIIHVGGMVALRKLIYLLQDRNYLFGDLPVEFFYEYRKDFVTYWFIVGIVYLWQHLRSSSAARPEPQTGPPAPLDRLIARKRDREFVINTREVDWIDACGNYANLHHRDGIFPVRASLAELEQRLEPASFARVHRSHIVNLDRISMIRPTASGDYRIHMNSGEVIRFSRRYRAQLKERLGL